MDFQFQNCSAKLRVTNGSCFPNVSTSLFKFALQIVNESLPLALPTVVTDSFDFCFETAGVVLVELAREFALDFYFLIELCLLGDVSSSMGAFILSSISWPSASIGSLSGFSYMLLMGITPALSLSLSYPVKTPPFFYVANLALELSSLSLLRGIENADRFDLAKAEESRGGSWVFLCLPTPGSFLFAL